MAKILKSTQVASGSINWDNIVNVPPLVKSNSGSTIYYVNNSTGSDDNDGLTVDTAFKTIQYAINILPKYLGYNVLINVAAGTYNEDITIQGFYGEGYLYIYGDTVVSTNYTVNSFYIYQCSVYVYIRGFNATTTSTNCFSAIRCMLARFDYCTATVTSGSYACLRLSYGFYYVNNCVFSNNYIGINAQNSAIVYTTTVTGTGNTTGVYSQYNCIVYLPTSSTITGTTPRNSTAGQFNLGNFFEPGNPNYNSKLTGDINIAVAGTYYDGASVSLPAGTYLITGQITCMRTTTTALTYSGRISDGTNHYASSEMYMPSASNNIVTLSMNTVITLTGTTTIKVQATGSQTGIIKAAGFVQEMGNNATQISAVRIA